ncbi:MAG: universal stress protein [Flavobacterium sp.]|nr:MAG: universal stress protein [Flavobacterium sp.]
MPTDFTEVAENAIQHAANLAKAGEDEVVLLHIINSDTKSKLKKDGETQSDLENKLQNTADELNQKHGIKASYKVREGSIFSEIGDVAEEIGARLLVIGTHGVLGMQHITGSHILKVASTSPVPVIIVQSKGVNASGIKNIVFPIDSTAENKQLAVQAMNIAKMYDSTVHQFVTHSTDEFFNNTIGLNSGYATRLFNDNGVKTEITYQDPKGPGIGKQLVTYASGVNSDLISIMNEDRSLAEFFIGPENERIINNDEQIPVMVLNPMEGLFIYQSVLGKYGKE